MPDIPTSAEGGVPGFLMSGWFGFWAPKGTPKDAIGTLNKAMTQVLADPAVKAKFSELGLDVAAPAAADAGRARGIPESRDREMVADHQGGGDQGGVKKVGETPRLTMNMLIIIIYICDLTL